MSAATDAKRMFVENLNSFGNEQTQPEKYNLYLALIYLTASVEQIHHLIRGPDLAKSMSKYLIDRIGALANVTLHPESEIVAIDGCEEGVSNVHWRNRKSGSMQTKSIRRIFLFVGADPNTGWLDIAA